MKLEMALNKRLKEYKDGIIEEDDLVYHQLRMENLGLVQLKCLP